MPRMLSWYEEEKGGIFLIPADSQLSPSTRFPSMAPRKLLNSRLILITFYVGKAFSPRASL